MAVQVDQINVLAELDRMGWEYEAVGEDEIKCRCPAHDDQSPSFSMSISKSVGKCHSGGCGWAGDIVSFMAMALKSTRRVILEDLSSRYNLDESQTVDARIIEKYHAQIWDAPHMLRELRKRGVTDDDIRKFRLGFNANRIRIPVFNTYGQCVNVRGYLPGAPGKEKMKNMRGRGRLRLYPVEQLKFDSILVCGGELKAIVAARALNKHGIGCICATGGEGNWEAAFSRELRDKRVWVCMDVDKEGRISAEQVAARIKSDAAWVGIVELPLDTDKYPHGDINDYMGPTDLGGFGATEEDFKKVLDLTKMWEPKVNVLEEDDTSEAIELDVVTATEAKNAGRKIKLRGLVAAIDSNPYLVPKRVSVDCDRNQPFCSICPVFATQHSEDNLVQMSISAQSPAILAMVNVGKDSHREHIREGLRIPPCKSVSFNTVEQYNVEEARIAPELGINARHMEEKLLPTLSVTHGLEGNVLYDIEGRTYPHPRTQKATLLVSSAKPATDALGQFNPTDDELAGLTIFQPREWNLDGLEAKLDDLYEDIEANVTHIFQRRDMHLLMDLAWHSTLLVRFDKRVVKGWAEVLVIGDSAQGKTETASYLQQHYGLGEKVESKNASAAGLLGGLSQMGNRWFVSWGKIPLNDRRLVILEELKGASIEVISRLTDMRSSGIAEIDKIEKRRTHARTRIIALSNPRSELPLASYNYGVEAIRELIGSPEDVRRFDAALVVASSELDSDKINVLSRNRPKVRHKHIADLCRKLVLWAWTRNEDQIEYTEEAADLVLKRASQLCSKFSDVIPLVDRGSMRLKLVRLSTALAVRTFSVGQKNNQVVVVRPCHVDYIANKLDRIYSRPAFGYSDFSEALISTRTLQDDDKIKSTIMATPFPKDFVNQVLHTNRIELRDLQDWCGWERGEATELLSFLVRKHALIREGRAYRKNPEFIELLKDLRESDMMERLNRPDHIPETKGEF